MCLPKKWGSGMLCLDGVGEWAASTACRSVTMLILIKGAQVLIALKLRLAISPTTLDRCQFLACKMRGLDQMTEIAERS